MAFLSLYRKYRPHSFEDLVGQNYIIQTLKNALTSGRIAHAYLFTGPRGTGKTSTAKVFAQALNCIHGPTTEPCGKCEACQKIKSGQSIDVIEIDAASNRGVDEIRDLRAKVKFYPSEGNYKVYIIDEVHMLTKGAFNALLKTLEEPPENVVFILATTEPHQVIKTILSRCQRFDFSLLSIHDIQGRLEYISRTEGIKYEDEALNMIARSANGGLRDAISILDQAISYTNGYLTTSAIQKMLGKVDKDILELFFRYINNYNSAEALKLVNQIVNRGNGISRFVNDLIEYGRQLLLIKECGKDSAILDYPAEVLEELARESQSIKSIRLIRLIEILLKIEGELRFTDQPKLVLEIGVVKMASPDADNSLKGLENRVVSLEGVLKEIRDGSSQIKQNEIGNPKLRQDQEKFPVKRLNQNKEKKEQDDLESELDGVKKVKQGESLTLDKVRKAWPVILNRVKEDNIKVQACLIEGKPVKVEEETIYIQFPKDKGFHKKGAENEEKFIRNIISKFFVQSCQLKFTIIGNETVNNKNDKGLKKKDKIGDLSGDNLINRVVKLFDGKIIKGDYDTLNNKGEF